MNKLFKPRIIKNLIKTILFTAIAVLGIGLNTASSYAGNCGCGNECLEKKGKKCENANTCWFEGNDWSSANGCGGHSWYDAPENNPYYCSICGIYYAENQISGTTTTHIQHKKCHYCVGIKSTSKVCAQPYVPPKYTITIHVNDAKESNTGNNGYNTYIGATFSNGQTVLSETVTEGESFSPISSADITALTNGIPKGWHFLGFYDGSGNLAMGTDGKFTVGSTASGNRTYYAKYARNNYTVKYTMPNPGKTKAGKNAVVTNGTDFQQNDFYYSADYPGFNGVLDFTDGTNTKVNVGSTLSGCPASVNGWVFSYWTLGNTGGQKVATWKDICSACNVPGYDNGHTFTVCANFAQAYVTLKLNDDGTETTTIVDYRDSVSVKKGSQGGPITTYFNANGGSVSPASIKTNKIFSYWDCSGDWSGGGSYNKITNTFINNNASSTNGKSYTLESVYTYESLTLPTATNSGLYVTDNLWYTASSGGNSVGAAGILYAPKASGTLYAHWNPVSLSLHAVTQSSGNYAKPTGYTDLDWGFSSDKGSSLPGVYKLYMSAANRTDIWSEINIANNDTAAPTAVNTKLNSSTTSWKAPYTGYYSITLHGAKGGNYGSYQGGNGGKIVMSVFMNKDQTLNFGTLSGGNNTGSGAAGGAGCYVKLNNSYLLAVAGGGGGANAYNPGGAGGESADIATATGASGSAGAGGGGGGAIGGAGGAANTHIHTGPDEKYLISGTHLSDDARYSTSGGCYTHDATSKCNGHIMKIWDGGFWPAVGTISAGYVVINACPECGTIATQFQEEYWTYNRKILTSFDPDNPYAGLKDEKGNNDLFYNPDAKEVYTGYYYTGNPASAKAGADILGWCNENNIKFVVHDLGNANGTAKGNWILFAINTKLHTKDTWYVNWLVDGSYKINHAGSDNYGKNYGEYQTNSDGSLASCYNEVVAYELPSGHPSKGGVTGSSASTGGKSCWRGAGAYYGTATNFYVTSASSFTGTETDTVPYVEIVGQVNAINITTEHVLTGLSTKDINVPEDMDDTQIISKVLDKDNNTYRIEWSDTKGYGTGQVIKDNGTNYYFKITGKLLSSGEGGAWTTAYNNSGSAYGMPCTVTVGMAGGKYLVDNNPSAVINASSGGTAFGMTGNHVITGSLTDSKQYLHIAYRDNNNNYSNTKTYEISPASPASPTLTPEHICTTIDAPVFSITTTPAYIYKGADNIIYLNTSSESNMLDITLKANSTYYDCKEVNSSKTSIISYKSAKYGVIDNMGLYVNSTSNAIKVTKDGVFCTDQKGLINIPQIGTVTPVNNSYNSSSACTWTSGSLAWTTKIRPTGENIITLTPWADTYCSFDGNTSTKTGTAVKICGDKTAPTISDNGTDYTEIMDTTSGYTMYSMFSTKADNPIKFKIYEAGSGIASLKLERKLPNTNNYTDITASITATNSGSYRYIQFVQSIQGVMQYRLTVTDNVGNVSIKSFDVCADKKPPIIDEDLGDDDNDDNGETPDHGSKTDGGADYPGPYSGESHIYYDWTNNPVLRFKFHDDETAISEAILYDDAGKIIATSADGNTIYFKDIAKKYEGVHTLKLVVKDVGGNTTTLYIHVKWDYTAITISGLDLVKQLKAVDVGDLGTAINVTITAEDKSYNGSAQSGIKDFTVTITNHDNGRSRTYSTTQSKVSNGGTRITPTTAQKASVTIDVTANDLLFLGDWDIVVNAEDIAHNKSSDNGELSEFTLDIELHSKFNEDEYENGYLKLKAGEACILKITVGGYADAVRFGFEELTGGFKVYRGLDGKVATDYDPTTLTDYDKDKVFQINGHSDFVNVSYQANGVFTIYYQLIIPTDAPQGQTYDIDVTALKHALYWLDANGDYVLTDMSGNTIMVNDVVNIREKLLDPSKSLTTPVSLTESTGFIIRGSLVDDIHTTIDYFE